MSRSTIRRGWESGTSSLNERDGAVDRGRLGDQDLGRHACDPAFASCWRRPYCSRCPTARRVSLTLEAENATVELTVRDDGMGFDPEAVPDGAGLRGMRERAVLIDARLDVTSIVGDGTTVRLSIR